MDPAQHLNLARQRFQAGDVAGAEAACREIVQQHPADANANYMLGIACLQQNRLPTAVFCANDEMAIGLLAHFQERGVSVPHQVSVLGYDDSPSAEFAAPRLTSVHIPSHEVTLAGLNWLLNRCYDMALPVERRFDITVTWRASVAAPPARKRS